MGGGHPAVSRRSPRRRHRYGEASALTPTCPSTPTHRMRHTMSTPYERLTAATARSSTAGHAGDSFGDQFWSALRLDEQSPRTPTRGLPVPRFAAADRSASTFYTVTAIDVWGRLADRSPLLTLGWRPGLPIAISVMQGAVVVVSHREGRNTVTGQGHRRLPASVRHRSRLKAGDRLLLAACPDRDLLVAYPTSA